MFFVVFVIIDVAVVVGGVGLVMLLLLFFNWMFDCQSQWVSTSYSRAKVRVRHAHLETQCVYAVIARSIFKIPISQKYVMKLNAKHISPPMLTMIAYTLLFHQ
jgi:hypothetical protein